MSSDEISFAISFLEEDGNAASSSSSMSHGGLCRSSRARLAGAGSGEGELRSSSMSQTAPSSPARPLLLGSSVAEVESAGAGSTVVAVVAAAEAAGSASLVVPVRKGRSNASLSLETFWGPKPGRRSSCAALACAIFAKLL